jgi:hypothetical protein
LADGAGRKKTHRKPSLGARERVLEFLAELLKTIGIVSSDDSSNSQSKPAGAIPRRSPVRAQILLAGHSHLHAFLGVPNSDAPKSTMVSISDDLVALVGPGPRTRDYWERLCEEADGRTVVLLWGGNEHNSFFLFESDRPFDVLLDGNDRIEDGREIIPQRMIRAKFDPAIEGLRYISHLLSEKRCKIIVAGTPPPQKDNDNIFARVLNEPDFQRQMLAHGLSPENLQISPPFLRLKLWRLLQTCIRETAILGDAEYFAVPSILTDEDGFILDCYSAGDVSHANGDYGRIYLTELLNWMRRDEPSI